jgi:hypothetical protein
MITPRVSHEPITAEMWVALEHSYLDANRIWKALMLAPTVEVCRALLAGESVPIERLDPAAVARLGRRPR